MAGNNEQLTITPSAESNSAAPASTTLDAKALANEINDTINGDTSKRRFAPTRDLMDGDEADQEEATSEEAEATEGQPDVKAEAPAEAEAPPGDEKKEALTAAERRHQRELRARDRLVQESRGRLSDLEKKNQELQEFVDGFRKDPVAFLGKSGVDIQQVGRGLVEKYDKELHAAQKDPRDVAIEELRAELAAIKEGSTKRSEEETAAQKQKRQQEDFTAATDYVTRGDKDFPYTAALGAEGVQTLVDSFYAFVEMYPDEVKERGQAACLRQVALDVEEYVANRERERHSRISKLVGQPASAATPGDGQKKPEVRKGQKSGAKSKSLSDGSTPFQGSSTPTKAFSARPETMEEKISRLADARVKGANRSVQ